MKKGIGILLFLGGMVFVIYFFIPQKPLLVEVGKVKLKKIESFIEEEGTTFLEFPQKITMPLAGKLSKILVKEGDRIEKGQLLAQIETKDLLLEKQFLEAKRKEIQYRWEELQFQGIENTGIKELNTELKAFQALVESAKKNEEIARIMMENQKRKYLKGKELFQKKTISEEQWEDMKAHYLASQMEYQKQSFQRHGWQTGYYAFEFWPKIILQWLKRKALTAKVIMAQKEQVEIQLAKIERQLQKCRLRSPISGVVLTRFISSPQELSIGSPIMLLGNLKELKVLLPVLTEDAIKIQKGQICRISFQQDDAPFLGKVERVYPMGFTKFSSLGIERKRVNVVIGFQKPPSQGGVDYRVYCKIIVGAKNKALVIPKSALFHLKDGKIYVFTCSKGVALQKEVQVGLENQEEAEILQGLQKDELVILSPPSNLASGRKVIWEE